MIGPLSMLVATDLSKNSIPALKRAATLATDLGVRLELLHVVEETVVNYFLPHVPDSELIEIARKQLLDQAEKEIPEGVEYRCRVEKGKPFLNIIRAARQVRAGLIVVAAHGKHALRNLFIGTTTERVVRKGEFPVLVVKKNPRTPYRRVVVPTDFSDAAGQALSTAMNLFPDAQIDLLHVYTLWGEGYQTSAPIRDSQQSHYQREMRSRASSAMAAWLRHFGLDDQRIRQHIRHGRPGTLIPKVAKELAADLVAMGTTGCSGLSCVLLGSVAEHALWQVPCDLLTVRPTGFRFELP